MKKGNGNHPTKETILGSIDLIAILTILSGVIYMGGWSYAYHYFGRFNLGLLALEIPSHYFLMYGYWVMVENSGLVVAIGIGYLIYIFLTLFLKRYGLQRYLTFLLLPLLVVLLFGVTYHKGESTGKAHYIQERQSGYITSPRIKVWMKEKAGGEPFSSEVKDALKRGCYKLLIQDKNNLFLFYPLKESTTAAIPLLMIPIQGTEAVKILPAYSRCGDGEG